MEDSKPVLKGGSGTPYLSIFNSQGNVIIDPKTNHPIGTYTSDFWYEYNEEKSDTCEITLDCDNPDVLSLPDLKIQSLLLLQWGWIYIDGTAYIGPLRKVVIRDYQSDFNENGTKIVIKCTDLADMLKNKPADYTNKAFGMWVENNLVGRYLYQIVDYEVDKGLVVATPWNQAVYGNGKKAIVEIQQPSVTAKNEFEGKEFFKSGDSTSVNQKLLEDRNKYYVGSNKVVDYKMLYGTDRTAYAQLQSFTKMLNGDFALDTRDDKITIHTPNFNQEPIASYTYAGGNGELLSCSVKTEKRSKKTSAARSSTVNPKTKEIDTHLNQSFVDVDSVPPLLRRPDDDTKKAMNSGRRSLKGISEYNDDPNQARQKKIDSAKDYKTTQEDLNRNYQATPEDIENALAAFKDDFTQKLNAYKSDPNELTLSELIGINSMGKFLVPVVRPVVYEVDPYKYAKTGSLKEAIVGEDKPDYSQMDANYGNANQVAVTSSTFNNYEGFNSTYARGNAAIRNNPSIIVIGESPNRETHTREEDFGANRYNYLKIVTDTKMYVELDGASVFNSAVPSDLQKILNSNHLNSNKDKQLVMDLKVVGRPELESGRIIEVKNISSFYSGLWYTKKVRHQLNPSSGYIVTANLIVRGLPKLSSETTSKVSPSNGISNWKKIKEAAKKAVESGYTPQDALSDYVYSIQQKAALDENFATVSQEIGVNANDLTKDQDSSKVVVSSSQDSVDINDQRIKERNKLSK